MEAVELRKQSVFFEEEDDVGKEIDRILVVGYETLIQGNMGVHFRVLIHE